MPSAGGSSPLAALSLAAALCSPALAEEPVQGSFLIANRDLGDPNFARTVVLLVQRDATGTVGLIINRSTPLELSSAFPGLRGATADEQTVFIGGPVAPGSMHVLLRSSREHEGSVSVFGDIRLSNSMDLLSMLAAQSEIPFRVYAGYSGWSAGQLENEIARGDWLVRPADPDSVFFEGGRQPWPSLAPQDPRDRVFVEQPLPLDQRLPCPSASRMTSSGILPG